MSNKSETPAPTQEQIDALKAQHGDLRRVKTRNGVFIVRAPSQGEWRRFRAEGHDKRKTAQSTETLVRGCVVYPAPEAFSAVCERAPGTVEALAEAVIELAGLEEAGAGEAL